MAEVALSGYSQLLAAVIRDVPGRTWDKQRRAWLVPAAWTADLLVAPGVWRRAGRCDPDLVVMFAASGA